jgi:hypothetical protein
MLAVLVTIPVAFGIFFAGVAGPNTVSGVSAALFGYLLPVATPGSVGMIPDRLAGWISVMGLKVLMAALGVGFVLVVGWVLAAGDGSRIGSVHSALSI